HSSYVCRNTLQYESLKPGRRQTTGSTLGVIHDKPISDIRQNVVLETHPVVGTTTEASLSTLPVSGWWRNRAAELPNNKPPPHHNLLARLASIFAKRFFQSITPQVVCGDRCSQGAVGVSNFWGIGGGTQQCLLGIPWTSSVVSSVFSGCGSLTEGTLRVFLVTSDSGNAGLLLFTFD
ncbi:hypothetical protein GBF38_019580, partial [Nibea albiflora]